MKYSPRWGRFRISEAILLAQQTFDFNSGNMRALMDLMGQMIVIQAAPCPYGDWIDYWAISPLFDEVPVGEVVPWYEIMFEGVDYGKDFLAEGHVNQCETVIRAIKRKPPNERW